MVHAFNDKLWNDWQRKDNHKNFNNIDGSTVKSKDESQRNNLFTQNTKIVHYGFPVKSMLDIADICVVYIERGGNIPASSFTATDELDSDNATPIIPEIKLTKEEKLEKKKAAVTNVQEDTLATTEMATPTLTPTLPEPIVEESPITTPTKSTDKIIFTDKPSSSGSRIVQNLCVVIALYWTTLIL